MAITFRRKFGASKRPEDFGCVGDRTTDDTAAFNAALAACSRNGLSLALTPGKEYRITGRLFMWGKCSIYGPGKLVFALDTATPFVINVGISALTVLEEVWSGRVQGVQHEIISGYDGTAASAGRLYMLWRTDGATFLNNHLDCGQWAYSLTSSGNNNDYVINGFTNCIRKNIYIGHNTAVANDDELGGECYALEFFDGIEIVRNSALGFGDDPIALHFCTNFKILYNETSGTDSRLFISQSQNGEIAYNTLRRVLAGLDGLPKTGIALLYVGWEDSTNPNAVGAPENIFIHHNTMIYEPGTIDIGSAMHLYGLRNCRIEDNKVYQNSAKSDAYGLLLQPMIPTNPWPDPSGLDSTAARIYQVDIKRNDLTAGIYPLLFGLTALNPANFIGPVVSEANIAGSYFRSANNVTEIGNVTVSVDAGVAALFAGGVIGGWYDPSDLSTMYQDYLGTTPAAVDSPVGKINDKSGNGKHLTQPTAASRPILRVDGSGNYYLEYDGVDDALVGPLLNTMLTANNYEVISAFRSTLATNNANPYNNSAVWMDAQAYVGLHIKNASGGLALPYHYDTAAVTLNVPYVGSTDVIISQRYAATLSAESSAGGSVLSTAAGSLGAIDNYFYIGGNTTYALPINGRIYGLIVHPVLTTAQRLTVFQFLARKLP